MSTTAKHAKENEATILLRVLCNEDGQLPPEIARYILDRQFSDRDKARMHDLAIRNQEGSLPAEREELFTFVNAGDLLGILKSRRVARSTSNSRNARLHELFMDAARIRLVWLRAGNCCVYCQFCQEFDETSFEIDHIISKKHKGLTIAGNLALSCFRCNTYKGTDIAAHRRDHAQVDIVVQSTPAQVGAALSLARCLSHRPNSDRSCHGRHSQHQRAFPRCTSRRANRAGGLPAGMRVSPTRQLVYSLEPLDD